MRRIDKNIPLLASVYKKWLDNLEETNANHPEYSSQHKFYVDVVANLLLIQQGLCAYTEQFLFDSRELTEDYWQSGRFSKGRFDFYGHLEHYDESLKEKKGWLWSNLFVVQADINNKKGTKSVLYALKPDDDNYDPFYLLEYNFREHRFLPNRNRDLDQQEKILHDINVLGLNFQSLIQERRLNLNPIIESINLNQNSILVARTKLREYFTAFEMCIQNLEI